VEDHGAEEALWGCMPRESRRVRFGRRLSFERLPIHIVSPQTRNALTSLVNSGPLTMENLPWGISCTLTRLDGGSGVWLPHASRGVMVTVAVAPTRQKSCRSDPAPVGPHPFSRRLQVSRREEESLARQPASETDESNSLLAP
jgi:hypothetical protein